MIRSTRNVLETATAERARHVTQATPAAAAANAGTAGHPADWGRFSDPALLILVSLAGGAKHGYAMVQDIERIAEVKLGPGTLYGALARLEEQGYIEPLPAEDRRRPYRLTDSGAAMLRAQLAALESVVTAGQRRLAPGTGD